jgi:enediyne biosynthesis protein E4
MLGCRGPGAGPTGSAAATAARGPVTFADVTQAAGIRFTHVNGGSGHKYMPETMGSGCAFLDVDGDDRLDLFLVNGRPLRGDGEAGGVGDTSTKHVTHVRPVAPSPTPPVATSALYRNNGDGTFTDITAGSGLDTPMFGMGCAVGDTDNDGRDDLYVTCALEPSHLFHNEGGGKFRDVTAAAGLGNGGRWATSAAWLDYDRDGRLDLFVCNYVKYDLAHDVFCPNRLGKKSYCTPRYYDGLPPALYHNEGGGRFRDVSAASGIGSVIGKGLGIAVCDVNRDGCPDLYVANDTMPNFLFRNECGGAPPGHSHFTEIGTEAGVAFGENGLARAGMGVDAAPIGPHGELALVVANFSNEPVSLFWEEGNSFFSERTYTAGLARATLLTLGFGAFFFDYDNDGAADLFIANGHVQDDIRLFQSNLSYAEPHQLFHNEGASTGRGAAGPPSPPGARPPALGPRKTFAVPERASPAFAEVGAAAGPPFTVARVSRGAAHGDVDNDGDLDLLVNNNNGPCELLRNDGGNRRHWLQTKLVGRRSNRDGIGAEVKVTAGGYVGRDRVRSGSSYCSASMLRLHFGLGDRARYDAIEVNWPSGLTERWPGGAADRMLTLTEGSGTRTKGDKLSSVGSVEGRFVGFTRRSRLLRAALCPVLQRAIGAQTAATCSPGGAPSSPVRAARFPAGAGTRRPSAERLRLTPSFPAAVVRPLSWSSPDPERG